MIKADIYLTNSNGFYRLRTEDNKEISGYEVFFVIIQKFKEKYSDSVHTIHESNEGMYVSFKESDYSIRLEKYGDRYYLILESPKDTLENFTERYNYIKSLLGE